MINYLKIHSLDIIILIFIFGLITTIALPIHRLDNKMENAYEAEITLSVARNMLLIHYQQNGYYPTATEPINLTELYEIDFDKSELNGKYYSASDYYYVSSQDHKSFKIKAVGTKPGVKLINREVNETGEIINHITF